MQLWDDFWRFCYSVLLVGAVAFPLLFDTKRVGARSAGNPHAACEMGELETEQNQSTV